MFVFYEFNTQNMIIILISTFILYFIFEKTKKDKENKSIKIDKLIISIIIGFLISLLFSYIKTGEEEKLLTDNSFNAVINLL